MNSSNLIEETREAIIQNTHEQIKKLIKKLAKQINDSNDQKSKMLEDVVGIIAGILKDPNEHPTTKYKTYLLVMYLISLMEPSVFESFNQHIFWIYRANCLYNKVESYEAKGVGFFRQNAHYSQANNSDKQQIQKTGVQHIIFSLETLAMLAKWIPKNLANESEPSNYYLIYESLINEGVCFPHEMQYRYYTQKNIEVIVEHIHDLEKDVYSSLLSDAMSTSAADYYNMSQSYRDPIRGSNFLDRRFTHNLVNQLKKENNKRDHRQLQLQKRLFEIELMSQQKSFQRQLKKQQIAYEQSLCQYEEQINSMSQQMKQMRSKITLLGSKQHMNQGNNNQKAILSSSNDQRVEKLQQINEALQAKIKSLQKVTKSKIDNRKVKIESYSECSEEITKLKKQNISLRQKLLLECQETSQFTVKGLNNKVLSKGPQDFQLMKYCEKRQCFKPFYSNLSNEMKVRLRKAILREKQLLYRDKIIEIGCITKRSAADTLKLTMVFTNVSEKPLLNFYVQFVTKSDLQVKLLNNPKKYIEISGQTKLTAQVIINKIDFRCLLCSVGYTALSKQQKFALILPISKLKLAEQLVYTPMNRKKKYLKLERVFQSDKKLLPTIHKVKQYFQKSLLEKDRTEHQTYLLKMQFLSASFYLEIDEIGNESRIAIMYEPGKIAEAEKLLDELIFIFSKSH